MSGPASGPDTIFALASGGGRAAVAVLRLSGPAAGPALAALTRDRLPQPRRASVRDLADPASGDILDRALCLWFPAPGSFTGEDVAELHLHGGRAVLDGVTEALLRLGCRVAEPGEFSRRAFDLGKLDLTEAEAIADLVEAETAAQRRQALGQLAGGLANLTDSWRIRLLRALAHLEADLDFPDEDLPAGVADLVRGDLATLAAEMNSQLAAGERGERLRTGLSVALLGAPNVGKSSLLNQLAGRDVAIVSARAGTTRDVIEVHLDLGGLPVTLADTAGLREATDEIEGEGVRRALAQARSADLKLLVFDASNWPSLDDDTLALVDDRSLCVLNKSDLRSVDSAHIEGRPVLPVSASTGAGIDALLARLRQAAAALVPGTAAPTLNRARHRAAVTEARDAVQRSLQAPAPELLAEDVRLAVRAIGRVTGRVDVEDVLDLIFREFCIGK